MKKLILVLSAVLMAFSIFSASFARELATNNSISDAKRLTIGDRLKTTVIKEIKVSLNEPKYGEKFDWAPVMETEGIKFDHMYWEGENLTDAGGYVGQNENDTAKATNYKATIYFTVESGYALSSDLKTGSVNGVDGLELVSLSFSPHGIKTQVFKVEAPSTRPSTSTITRPSTGIRPSRPIATTTTEEEKISSGVNFTIGEVKPGSALPASGEYHFDIMESTGQFNIPMENPLGKMYWTPNDEKAKFNTEYTLTLMLNMNYTKYDKSQFRAMVNLVEVPSTFEDGWLVVKYKVTTPKLDGEKIGNIDDKVAEVISKMEATKSGEVIEPTKSGETVEPPKEPNWINNFEVKVTEPKAGEKPATSAEAVTDGFKVTKVTWTPNDATFQNDTKYTVKIYVTIDEGRTLRSDYFGIVNGKQAEMPIEYDKDNFFIEYNFGKIEWKKASEWAESELNNANNLGLIPDIFNKEDLTTNITRKEFAHVVVKLYEKISGQKAIAAAKNPFKDTDDVEVLKAYNIGITNGTSDDAFSPNNKITREQMATMMTRALAKAGIDTSVDLSKVDKFADEADMHNWGKESIYYMSSIGLIKGIGDNKFGVTGDATREQALLISSRSADKFVK